MIINVKRHSLKKADKARYMTIYNRPKQWFGGTKHWYTKIAPKIQRFKWDVREEGVQNINLE